MADVDLTSVPLSALTAEIKRRMLEFEDAKKQLGFGEPVRIGRPPKTATTSTERTEKNPRMSSAAFGRWSGWKAFKRAHKGATTKDYYAWRREQKAKKR